MEFHNTCPTFATYPFLPAAVLIFCGVLLFPWFHVQTCRVNDELQKPEHERHVVSISYCVRQPVGLAWASGSLLVVFVVYNICIANEGLRGMLIGLTVNFLGVLFCNPEQFGWQGSNEELRLRQRIHMGLAGVLFLQLLVYGSLIVAFELNWGLPFIFLYVFFILCFLALFVSYLVGWKSSMEHKKKEEGGWTGVVSHFEHLYVILFLVILLSDPRSILI